VSFVTKPRIQPGRSQDEVGDTREHGVLAERQVLDALVLGLRRVRLSERRLPGVLVEVGG
jgi:hypothetical protein